MLFNTIDVELFNTSMKPDVMTAVFHHCCDKCSASSPVNLLSSSEMLSRLLRASPKIFFTAFMLICLSFKIN